MHTHASQFTVVARELGETNLNSRYKSICTHVVAAYPTAEAAQDACAAAAQFNFGYRRRDGWERLGTQLTVVDAEGNRLDRRRDIKFIWKRTGQNWVWLLYHAASQKIQAFMNDE